MVECVVYLDAVDEKKICLPKYLLTYLLSLICIRSIAGGTIPNVTLFFKDGCEIDPMAFTRM